MIGNIEVIQEHARELNLTGLAVTVDVLLEDARKNEPSYSDFALTLLETERSYRKKAQLERRRKTANLPLLHDLDHYDSGVQNGISQVQLRQLRQLLWLDQNYNLIMIGLSGTGKTYLAGGLCHEALKLGYHALFRTMDDLIQTINDQRRIIFPVSDNYNSRKLLQIFVLPKQGKRLDSSEFSSLRVI